MKEELKRLKSKFNQNLVFDEKLSKYSWFNIGGPAEIFFRAENRETLSNFLKEIKKYSKPIFVIGAGSNTLIRDGGLNGITIKLSSKFSYTKLCNNDLIEVGAATLDKKLANFALENSFKGLEFFSCIPGSIGGAIKMNSGCYGYEVSQVIDSLEIIDFDGKIKEIKKDQINFTYRNCNLNENFIILSAKFKITKSDKSKIKTVQEELIKRKKNSQPSRVKTCGSTFKNPNKKKAWELIKKADCKNIKVGDVKISEKHCNFFVNNGNGTSSNIEELISKVRKKVEKVTGEKLELEIKIVGKNI